MRITLTPELEERINQKVTSGEYDSASDVLNAALNAFLEQELADPLPPEELRREIALGLQHEQEGKVKPFDAEGLKRRVRTRPIVRVLHGARKADDLFR